MKIPYPLKRSSMWQVRLLCPPLFHFFADMIGLLLAPLLSTGWYGQKPFWTQYLPEFLLGTLGMYVITESNFWSYFYLEQKLPWERNSGKRLTIQLIFSTIFSIIAAFIIRWMISWIHPDHTQIMTESFVVLTASTTFVLSVIFLGIFVFHRMSDSLIETEQLKRENLIAQNQALRQQIDPHFLFNSITTLTTLIEENKDLAIEFVRRLSKVYRHVLQSKEHDLVDLKTEIDIVRDYAFAFQMRFGDQFRMTIDLPDDKLSYQIPPLTLQILVENAVKHNIISQEHPLHIHIGMDGNSRIAIRNNLQRKPVHASPTHIGLDNILARYKFVSQGIVEVIEGEKEFIVKLPILKS